MQGSETLENDTRMKKEKNKEKMKRNGVRARDTMSSDQTMTAHGSLSVPSLLQNLIPPPPFCRK